MFFSDDLTSGSSLFLCYQMPGRPGFGAFSRTEGRILGVRPGFWAFSRTGRRKMPDHVGHNANQAWHDVKARAWRRINEKMRIFVKTLLK